MFRRFGTLCTVLGLENSLFAQEKVTTNYIMIMCHIDSNASLAEPMKNRSGKEMIRAYLALIARGVRAGFAPKKHIPDNEGSEEIDEVIRERGVSFECDMVPPGFHCANLAKGIQNAGTNRQLSMKGKGGTRYSLPQNCRKGQR